MYVISGYKSPQTPNVIFTAQLLAAANSIKDSSAKVVLIGDFNIDQKNHRIIVNALSKFKINSKLLPSVSTTNYNTQIDIVFANFNNIIAGTYESYFSDHKPVFCMLMNGEISADMLDELNSEWTQPAEKKTIEPKMRPPVMPLPKAKLPVFDDSDSDNSDINDQSSSSSSSIIEISDNGSDSEDAEDAEQEANRRFTNIINEITTEFSYLTDASIDYFIRHLASPVAPSPMTETIYAQQIQKYKPHSLFGDNVQILFCGTPHEIGHYIVVHYFAEKDEVRVYDSLGKNVNKLYPGAALIVDRLFKNKPIRFMKPVTTQPDFTSCGVLALANLTTILHGQDPEQYPYDLIRSDDPNVDRSRLLRKHLAKMIIENKWELFPTSKPRIRLSRLPQSVVPRANTAAAAAVPPVTPALQSKKQLPTVSLNRPIKKVQATPQPEILPTINDNKNNEAVSTTKKKKESDGASDETRKLFNEIGTDLVDDTIVQRFIQMVQETTGRDMRNVWCVEYRNEIANGVYEYFQYIPDTPLVEDDVQILFNGDNFEARSHLGHYICVHYSIESRQVSVYDSLYDTVNPRRNVLSQRHLDIINQRYPNRLPNIDFVKPRTLQTDGVSCGVFAIAYATMLLFGRNPGNTALKIDRTGNSRTASLRRHLAEMLIARQLRLFPEF